MTPTSAANISIEIFGAVMSLVLIICLNLDENKDSKLNRIFFHMLAWNIALMLCDAISYAMIGNTTVYGYYLVRITNFFVFCISFVLLTLYTNYVTTYINAKTSVTRLAVYINYVICAAAILLTIISQFNDMLYYFDENNVFCRQDASWIPQALAIACFIVMAVVIIRNKRYLSMREIFFLISYVLLPIVAVAIQFFIYDPVLMFMATTLSLFSVYTGIQADQSRLIKQQELELSRRHVMVMLSQIQPHFLYNALTAIQELCYLDPKAASETAGEFSKYLRGNLDSLSINHTIPFDKELEHVENYLTIEKTRFGAKLTVVYHISVRSFKLPALTLQPIVENAVRHGVTKREEGGSVTVSTEETKNGYTITVTDNGVGFDTSASKQDERSHIGVDNVRSRLIAMCGGTLTIRSRPNIGTTAVITIPKGGTNV